MRVCGSSYNWKRWLKLQDFVAAVCVFVPAATIGKIDTPAATIGTTDMLQGFVSAMFVFVTVATTAKVG